MHLTYPAQNLTTKTTGTRKRAFQRSKTVTNTIPLDIVCAKIATNLMMSTNIISTTCHTFTQIAHVTNAIKNVCAEIATPPTMQKNTISTTPLPANTSHDLGRLYRRKPRPNGYITRQKRRRPFTRKDPQTTPIRSTTLDRHPQKTRTATKRNRRRQKTRR